VLAGERALRRYGMVESLGHFRRAQRLLASVPEGRERDEFELRALLGIGEARFVVETPHGEDLVSAYDRAIALASKLGDDARLCDAIIGRKRWRLIRGDFRAAGEPKCEMLDVIERAGSPSQRATAFFLAGVVNLMRGRLADAKRRLDQARALDVEGDGAPVPNPAIAALAVSAQVAWLVGRSDEALRLARTAVELAETVRNPFELCAALYTLGNVHAWRGEHQLAEPFAKRALRMAEEERFALWQQRAASILLLVSAEASSANVDAGVDAWGGSRAGSTLHSLAIITRCIRSGETERAFAEIRSALALGEEVDERYVEPELHRLRGEILQASDKREAERAFTTAIEIARKQGSVSFELRATLSLYRHSEGQKRHQARVELRRLVSGLTEGLDTADVIEAQSISKD